MGKKVLTYMIINLKLYPKLNSMQRYMPKKKKKNKFPIRL